MTNLAERRKQVLDSMVREAVYEGAVRVLTEHGLKGTTMDRVAAAAGMAKGSLYNHFGGKQELLEFVHARAIKPMLEALDAIAREPLNAAEKLIRVSRMWREYLVQNQAVFQFFISDHTAKGLLHSSEQTGRATAIQQITAIIEQGIEQGTLRAVDARAVGEMFVTASVGMVEQELAAGAIRSVASAVDVLMSVFLHGICAHSVGSRMESVPIPRDGAT